jgi:predicted GIY-YIG superfamily endonuclease
MDENGKKHYWLYVLKLEQGKYYVGITTQTPEARFAEHIRGGRTSYWTANYSPLSIHDRKDLGTIAKKSAERFEDKVTVKYMRKYGSENVQGGRYTDRNDVFALKFGHVFTDFEWRSFVTVFSLLVIVVCLVLISLFK